MYAANNNRPVQIDMNTKLTNDSIFVQPGLQPGGMPMGCESAGAMIADACGDVVTIATTVLPVDLLDTR